MSENNVTLPTTEMSTQVKGRFWKFNLVDRGILVVAICGCLITNFIVGKLAVAGIIALWYAMMHATRYGHAYDAVICQNAQNLWIRWVRKNYLWKQKKKGISWPGNEVIPLELNVLRGEDGDGFGVAFNKQARTDSVIVKGSGSSITAKDLPEMHAAHMEIAAMTKRLLSQQGSGVGVSNVFRIRPYNGYQQYDFGARNYHSEIVFAEEPDNTLQGEELSRNMRNHNLATLIAEEDALFAQNGKEVTMAMVFTVHRQGALAGAIAKGKSLAQDVAQRLPAVRLAKIASAGLRHCGVDNVQALDSLDIHAYMRGAWDIAETDKYYDWLADQREKGITFDLVGEAFLPWPQHEIRAFHDYAILDGSYHAVIQLERFPQVALPSTFLGLYNMNARYFSVAFVGDTVKSRREEALINTIIGLSRNFDEWRGTIRKSTRARRREQALEQREEEIATSQFTQAGAVLIAISGATWREMEDGVQEVMEYTLSEGLSPTRIVGESRQKAALLTATTGINLCV